MKKLLLIAAMFSVVAVANAQDMNSKRGTPILPEAGDYSIGISAAPFIDWAFDKTRIFSNTSVSGSSGAVNSQMPLTLVGLSMKDANTAYRGKLRIGFNSATTGHVSENAMDSTGVPSEVKVSGMNITLGAGIQKSRGKGRLHGIYGAEAAIMLNGAVKTTHTFDQALDSAHNNGGVERVMENKTGSTFGLGIDAFVGVEYFCAPKMSVSAEYNWGLMISSTGESETSTQKWDLTASPNALVSKTTKGAKSSSFGLDVANINSAGTGNIVFHFYF